MKKLLSAITAMVLVFGLSTTGVQAEETNDTEKLSYEQVVQMVKDTNSEVYAEVDKADDKADTIVLSFEKDIISESQMNEEVNKIIDELIKITNKKVAELIKVTGKSGYVIEPVWVEVEVGGRTVLVDPCVSDGL